MREELVEQIDLLKNTKVKKLKEKNKEMRKKLENHLNSPTNILLLAKMMQRLYYARKKLIYRTLALMKIQEQKESLRKDRDTFTKKMKSFEKILEDAIEVSRREVEQIADLLQLTADKKKESIETYNQIMKPVKTLRIPTGFQAKDGPEEAKDEDSYFPKSIYLAVMKKTAVGKTVFKKIQDYLEVKEDKFKQWRDVDKIRFWKKQTSYLEQNKTK